MGNSKVTVATVLCLTAWGGLVTASFARPSFSGSFSFTTVPQTEYQTDIDRIRALRLRPLDEVVSLASELEPKWRRIDWNSYASIMEHVCSEISNRGPNNAKVREQSEHFAMVALSHASMYSWEHESFLLGWLGYQRTDSNDAAWLRKRSVKAQLWLHAFQRFEKEFDENFDINDRKNVPASRVTPPLETGLPPGVPASAIKDPRLRAKYEAAIAENKRKSRKVEQQMPLRLHGPSFKERAVRWLVQAYSQPPVRKVEISRYLQLYIRDTKTRQEVLDQIEKKLR